MVSPKGRVNRVLVVMVGLFLVGVLCLLGAGQSMAVPPSFWPDPFEPNDTEPAATRIYPPFYSGDYVDHLQLSNDGEHYKYDIDYFRFEVNYGDKVGISGVTDETSFYGPSGNWQGSTIATPPLTRAGTHYIKVVYRSVPYCVNYNLRVWVRRAPTTTTTTLPSTTTTTVPSTTTTTVPPTTTTTLPQSSFVDVSTSHPYFAPIQDMAAAGIVSGYPVGGYSEFRPSNPVWRAQFAKMVCGAFDIAVNEDMTSSFTDLGSDDPDNLYPHEYVAAAALNGITTGVSPGLFAPYHDITRAQVVTMMVRAAQQLASGTLAEPPAGYVGSIGDFSPTHYPSMRTAEYNGLLTGLIGFGSGWDPWQKATRGEVAQMLWQVMKRLQ